jgi:hypothetical protein
MKTRERTKSTAEEPRWYESAARPSAPGELTKAEPAGLTEAGPEEGEDAGAKSRRMRWIVIIYVLIATVAVALGNVFDSIYWAAIALFFAVAVQPRERVPKLLRYFSIAAVMVLGVVQIVLFILKHKAG